MSDQPDLKRLVDESSSRLGDLLRSSELDQPSEQQLRALDAAIAPLLNGPPGGGGGSGGAAPRIAGPASAGAGVKVALALAVAVGGGGLFLARRQQQPPEPPPPIAHQIEPTAAPEVGARVEPPVPEVPVEAPVVPIPQHAVVTPHPNRLPPPPAAVVEPEDELVSLQRLVDAMRAGHAAEALAAAEQHRRQHPDSAMAQERELVAIEALVSLQRMSEARERASAFRRQWPTSTHQTRLDELMGP